MYCSKGKRKLKCYSQSCEDMDDKENIEPGCSSQMNNQISRPFKTYRSLPHKFRDIELNQSIAVALKRALALSGLTICPERFQPTCESVHGEGKHKSQYLELDNGLMLPHSAVSMNLDSKVYIGGLPTSITSDKLCQIFEHRYGPIIDAVMVEENQVPHRRLGIVTFKFKKSAVDAVKEHKIEVSGNMVEIMAAATKASLINPTEEQNFLLDNIKGRKKIIPEESWLNIFNRWFPLLMKQMSLYHTEECYPLSSLKGDFKATCGMQLDHASIGYAKLSDFIEHYTDVCEMRSVIICGTKSIGLVPVLLKEPQNNFRCLLPGEGSSHNGNYAQGGSRNDQLIHEYFNRKKSMIGISRPFEKLDPDCLGTCTVGVKYKGGVMLGSDTKVTSIDGKPLAEYMRKIQFVAPDIAVCFAGNKHCCNSVSRDVTNILHVLGLIGHRITVARAADEVAQVTAYYEGMSETRLIVGGWHPDEGAKLYKIFRNKKCENELFSFGGIGSKYMWEFFQEKLESGVMHQGLDRGTAQKLVEEALHFACLRDRRCGGAIVSLALDASRQKKVRRL